MKGYTTNIVNLIADNLRDRYPTGLQIIKELIQNADDAKDPHAKRFEFGWHPGFGDSSDNPLLKGSALYFFNDGGFSKDDERAISSFAENSKAAEDDVIGKYGLGMKSVFHLCEAFFYLGYNGQKKFREGINPWKQSNNDLHPDWDQISDQDWLAMENVAKAFVATAASPWFLLWLPLRKKAHLRTPEGRETGSITNQLPGETDTCDLDFLRDKDLPRQLATFLPLLQHIDVIRYYPEQPGNLDGGFQLQLKTKNRIDHQAKNSESSGSVEVIPEKASFPFTALQARTDSEIFNRLKKSDLWPKTYCRDEFGQVRQERYRAIPEAGVIIQNFEGSSASLTIRWAVFLPLENEAHSFHAKIEGGSLNYIITLHGQYFMDAGRQGIFGFDLFRQANGLVLPTPQEESHIRSQWNRLITDEVVLSLLIPTIEVYGDSFKTNERERICEELTKAITKASLKSDNSSFINQFRLGICKNYQWVKLISRNSKPHYARVSRNTRLLPLPQVPESNPKLPWDTFRKLDNFAISNRFFDYSSPSITVSTPRWEEKDLLRILNFGVQDAKRVFQNRSLIGYLADFIESISNSSNNSLPLQQQLIRLLGFCFKENDSQVLSQNRASIKRLVGMIDSVSRIKLSSGIPWEICVALWERELSHLLVPADMEPGNQSGGKLDEKGTFGCLKTLSPFIEQYALKNQKREMIKGLEFAQELLKSLDTEDRTHLLTSQPDLRVMAARDARGGKEVAVSVRELIHIRKDGGIFGYSGGIEKERLAFVPLLANVLPEERFLLVRSQIYREIFSNEVDLPRSDNAVACLKTLGSSPKRLGDLSAREEFLENVNNPAQDKKARRGLRYVLHGSHDNFYDERTSLWVSGHQQSDAWEKLWRQVIGIEGRGDWNFIDRRLGDTLPRNRWDLVGIKEISFESVLEQIRIGPFLSIDPDAFSNEECIEILTNIREPDLWKRLPLHETIREGRRISVDQDTYLESGEPLQEGLKSTVNIIKKSSHPSLATQQSRWLKPLTPKNRIQIALGAPNKHLYWRTIMDVLEQVCNQMDESLLDKLRAFPWLPTLNDQHVSPNKIIDLPELADDLERLTTHTDSIYYSPRQLPLQIRNHPSYDTLSQYALASGNRAFEAIGDLLVKSPEFHIGKIPQLSYEHIQDLIPFLSEIEMLPGWSFLKRALDIADDREDCYRIFFPAINNPIDPDKTVSILTQLANTGNSDTSLKRAYNLYLRAFASDQAFATNNLHKLKLLSHAGNWRWAEDLCAGVTGLSKDSVLDDEQEKILAGIISKGGGHGSNTRVSIDIDDFEIQLKAACNIAKDYFREWQGLVPNGLMGALLALFGGQEDMRGLAAHYLAPHSLDWFADMLQWQQPENWLRGHTAQEALKNTRFVLKIADPDGFKTVSLTGEALRVQLGSDFETLIVGEIGGQGYDVILTMRRFNPLEKGGEVLAALLKRTIEYLLLHLYEQHPKNLDSLWEELDSTNQMETDVARRLILEHLPFYFRQLSLHRRHPGLAEAMKRCDEAQTRLIEAEKLDQSDIERKRQDFRDAVREIAETVENDENAQKTVLEAYRTKLKDLQYGHDGIPFELFQNADDAALEQSQIERYLSYEEDFSDVDFRFVAQHSDHALRFMHWGRPINSRGPVGFDGEKRGFHHDLENMLILASSDKAPGGRGTGKFGVGFKSVFLACDRPKIISGRLRIEILAGILPQLWENPGESLTCLGLETQDQARPGTLIELSEVDESAILESFRRLSGILCVFGREIHRIDFQENGTVTKCSWFPSKITDRVEKGKLNLVSSEWGRETLALYFGLSEVEGGILLAIGPQGFRRLPDDVPSLWVTAPTKDHLNIGFAVNADFDIDVGRAQLAMSSERNRQVFNQLGNLMGEALLGFYDSSGGGWNEFCERLRVSITLKPYALWWSLWDIFGSGIERRLEGGGESLDLVRHMLWGKPSMGMRHLVSKRQCLPTGLWGDFRVLTQIGDVKYSAKGALDNEAVFTKACNFEGFRSRVTPGHIVSNKLIGQKLKKLGVETTFQPVDLFSVLKWETSRDYRIDPNRAGTYGMLVNEELLNEMESGTEASSKEKETIVNLLKTARFLGEDNRYHTPGSLLVEHDLIALHKDEALRAKFAPPDRILLRSYDENGIAFFRACRGRLEAGPEELADWAISAPTDSKKHCAMQYLLQGDLRRQVSWVLHMHLMGSWIEELPYSDLMDDFNEYERAQLLGLLHLDPVAPEPEPIILDPQSILQSIYEWWRENKDHYLRKYENDTFPDGNSIVPNTIEVERNTSVRKDWLKLFLLGATHTMGRTQQGQNKSFLNKCDTEGWLEVFSQPDQDPNVWMRVLKKYFDQETTEIEFHHWMKQLFVIIFQFAKWLPEYTASFLAMNQYRTPFLLTDILRPRTNAVFQGGGPDAPPITRTLGIGGNFVVRELVRGGVVRNKYAYPHCYVPVQSVRNLMARLGCNAIYDHLNNRWDTSKHIHEYLVECLGPDHAIFDDDFDIPLFIISRDAELFERFFKEPLPEDDEIHAEESI